MAIDKSNNVGMVEALEDVDLRGEVIFEFLIELPQVDGLDGYVGSVFLSLGVVSISRISPDYSESHYRSSRCRLSLDIGCGDSPNGRPDRR